MTDMACVHTSLGIKPSEHCPVHPLLSAFDHHISFVLESERSWQVLRIEPALVQMGIHSFPFPQWHGMSLVGSGCDLLDEVSREVVVFGWW